jgi:hypothetical protein
MNTDVEAFSKSNPVEAAISRAHRGDHAAFGRARRRRQTDTDAERRLVAGVDDAKGGLIIADYDATPVDVSSGFLARQNRPRWARKPPTTT